MSEAEPEIIAGEFSDDSGLTALAAVLAIHRIAVDPAQLRHALGHHEPATARDLLRLARAVSALFESLRIHNGGVF